MILGRQINSLLKRHTAVFVLGLGTFRRIRTAASYDAKRNVVLPPLSYIEFEHDVQEGYDYTLYVQQTNQIERAEAERVVQQEVDKLRDAIHTDGQVSLDELGYLVSYGNSFIFKPLDLSGFQFLPIENTYKRNENDKVEEPVVEAIDEKVVVPTDPQQAFNNASQNSEDKIVVTQTIESDIATDDFNDVETRKSNSIVYVLIAIVALIAMGGIYYYSILSKKLDNVDEFLSTIDSTALLDDTTNYSIYSDTLASVDSSDLIVTDTSNSQIPESPAAVVEEKVLHKYAIVVGTHPKIAQAEAEAEEYHKKGFKHVRALPANLEKNRKKVIWDTYPTKELRDSALRYVQKNVKADAWPTVL